MRHSRVGSGLLTLILVSAPAGVAWQAEVRSFKIYAEHPRLFLTPARLKLLLRERERRSTRWNQFETLMAGKAPMPERGFAQALYFRVGGDRESGRQAVAWALGPGNDLRQLAMVFDWCQDLLSAAESQSLAARLERGIEQSRGNPSVDAVRSRLLAAIALAGHRAETSAREIESIVAGWWERDMIPALRAGRPRIAREDAYALYEIFHSLRDNLDLDLRENYPKYFKNLPIEHLVTHYPATYPAGENDYRIGASHKTGEPDLRAAALSRAAELSMVAFDINAPESQVLQGWLMHDNFQLRSTLGAPYEFLWANPYQPGLSYFLVPLLFHDPQFGRLFLRSSWDEAATWLGYWDGQLQLFRDGRVTVLNPQLTGEPLSVGEAVVFSAAVKKRFRILLKEDERVFVLGLKPRTTYAVEVDNEEMHEQRTDAGGMLMLDLPHKVEVGFRLAETAPAPGRRAP